MYRGRVRTKGSVEELEPPVRLGWKAISGGGAPGGWDGATIAFDLQAEGSDTVLTFAYRGFRGLTKRDGNGASHLDKDVAA